MAKNNKLINAMKEVAKRNRDFNQQVASDKSAPMIYSGICLTLKRKYGWEKEQIEELVYATEAVWNELGGWEIIKQCADECDFLLWNDLIKDEMYDNGYKEWIDSWIERNNNGE